MSLPKAQTPWKTVDEAAEFLSLGHRRVLEGEDYKLLEEIFEQFFVETGSAGAAQNLVIEEVRA